MRALLKGVYAPQLARWLEHWAAGGCSCAVEQLFLGARRWRRAAFSRCGRAPVEARSPPRLAPHAARAGAGGGAGGAEGADPAAAGAGGGGAGARRPRSSRRGRARARRCRLRPVGLVAYYLEREPALRALVASAGVRTHPAGREFESRWVPWT